MSDLRAEGLPPANASLMGSVQRGAGDVPSHDEWEALKADLNRGRGIMAALAAVDRHRPRIEAALATPPAPTGSSSATLDVALDVERLALLHDAARFLALRPSGQTGALDDRIPWFTHSGISHGADRPDCVVCQWEARYAALAPEQPE